MTRRLWDGRSQILSTLAILLPLTTSSISDFTIIITQCVFLTSISHLAIFDLQLVCIKANLGIRRFLLRSKDYPKAHHVKHSRVIIRNFCVRLDTVGFPTVDQTLYSSFERSTINILLILFSNNVTRVSLVIFIGAVSC